MKDERKTKNELMRELRDLRDRVRLLDALCLRPEQGAGTCLPLQSLFDAIHEGITLMDRDLTVVMVNSTVERWYSHAQPIVGRKCHEAFLGRATVCPDCPTLAAFETGNVQFYEAHRLGPEGQDGWLEVYASPIRGEDGRTAAVIEYARDITKRKLAETALARSEENYRLLVENQADMIVKLDPRGHILFASPALCRALGRTEGELLGTHYTPYIHAEDRAQAEAVFQGLGPDNLEVQVETRVQTPQGHRWQSWACRAILGLDGRLAEVVGTGRDIEDTKRASQAVAASESLFRTLTETATIGIFIIQGERFVYVNPAGERICGRSLDALREMHFWDLVHPSMRDQVRERGLARMDGRSVPQAMEQLILTPDGQERWLEISSTFLEYQGAPAIMGTAQDITERRRAERALQESEARFHSVFDSAAVGIVLADPRGRITDANRTLLDMFGMELAEALGRTAADFAFPEEVGETRRHIGEVAALQHRTFRIEKRYRRKDGTALWADMAVTPILDEAGRLKNLLGVLLDVTRSKQAGLRLAETLAEMDSILENSLVGILVMRGREVVQINSRMADMLGFSREELLTQSARLFHVSEKHFHEFGQTYQNRLDRTQFTNIEYPLRRKDGREIWCRIAGKAIDRADLARGVVWCVEDITEEKKAQQALRHYAKDLYRAKQQAEDSARRLSSIIQELDQKNDRLEQEIAERRRVEAALRESERRYRELSIRDELTGLFNVRHFYVQAEAELRRTLRYDHPLSLIFIDLDDFKKLNDAHGHLAGDKVLAALGAVLRSAIRDTDMAFRYGGEEFIILLPETAGAEAVTQAERVRQRFRELALTTPEGAPLTQTLSIGVAQLHQGESLSDFVHRADSCMYEAKTSGKDRCLLAGN